MPSDSPRSTPPKPAPICDDPASTILGTVYCELPAGHAGAHRCAHWTWKADPTATVEAPNVR